MEVQWDQTDENSSDMLCMKRRRKLSLYSNQETMNFKNIKKVKEKNTRYTSIQTAG